MKKFAIIAKNPLLFRESDFENTHFVVLENFNIYFKFDNKHVYITAFWDNRRNPESLKNIIK